MNKKLTLLLLLLTGCSSGISDADYSAIVEENTALKDENRDLKEQIVELGDQIEELKNGTQKEETKEHDDSSQEQNAVDYEAEIVIDKKNNKSIPLFDVNGVKATIQSYAFDSLNNRYNMKILVENDSDAEISIYLNDAKLDNRYAINPSYYNMSTKPNTTSIEEISIHLYQIDDYGDIDWSEIDGRMDLTVSGESIASRTIKIDKNV